jgi:hypothetical protein
MVTVVVVKSKWGKFLGGRKLDATNFSGSLRGAKIDTHTAEVRGSAAPAVKQGMQFIEQGTMMTDLCYGDINFNLDWRYAELFEIGSNRRGPGTGLRVLGENYHSYPLGCLVFDIALL